MASAPAAAMTPVMTPARAPAMSPAKTPDASHRASLSKISSLSEPRTYIDTKRARIASALIQTAKVNEWRRRRRDLFDQKWCVNHMVTPNHNRSHRVHERPQSDCPIRKLSAGRKASRLSPYKMGRNRLAKLSPRKSTCAKRIAHDMPRHQAEGHFNPMGTPPNKQRNKRRRSSYVSTPACSRDTNTASSRGTDQAEDQQDYMNTNIPALLVEEGDPLQMRLAF